MGINDGSRNQVRWHSGSGWQSVSLHPGRKEITDHQSSCPETRNQSGMRALIVGAPPVYLKLLVPLPKGVVITSTADGVHPFVQVFATSLAEISKVSANLLRHVAGGGLLWIAYPKKTSGIESDLSRDLVAEAMSRTGWRPVSIIAIDEIWSALRFRPSGDVKAKQKL